MKYWDNYIDKNNLVINGDTGDSCRETATALCANLDEYLNLAECWTDNGWVRHPIDGATEPWHADTKEFSRDQWIALMCLFIVRPADKYLTKTWVIQKLFRCQNGDPIFYEYVLYLRAFKLWWAWPLMAILDSGLLINVIIRVVKSYINTNDTADDINTTNLCVTFRQKYSTPLVFLSCLIYKLRKNGVLAAWQSYYSRLEAPPMDKLWESRIKEYL